MKTRALKLLPSALLLIVPLLLAVVSQSGRPQTVAAQTGGGTAVTTAQPTATTSTTGGPVSVCGTVSSFTAATSTAAGSLTLSTANINTTFTIPAGTTLVNQGAITTGANICVTGLVGASSTLTSAVITTNAPTTIDVCGPVTAYTAATSSTLGSVTIAGIVFPTALGSTFTGLTVGSNVCLLATLSGNGNLVSGTAVTNTSGALSLTGPFTTFIPPTATTPGSVTFGSATFVIPAGSTIKVGGSVPLSASIVGGGRTGAGMIAE